MQINHLVVDKRYRQHIYALNLKERTSHDGVLVVICMRYNMAVGFGQLRQSTINEFFQMHSNELNANKSGRGRSFGRPLPDQ